MPCLLHSSSSSCSIFRPVGKIFCGEVRVRNESSKSGEKDDLNLSTEHENDILNDSSDSDESLSFLQDVKASTADKKELDLCPLKTNQTNQIIAAILAEMRDS